jgi:ABC-type multidrug transport system fused ATPase/permease subunit
MTHKIIINNSDEFTDSESSLIKENKNILSDSESLLIEETEPYNIHSEKNHNIEYINSDISEDLIKSEPISCILKLMADYMDCDSKISKHKVEKAWKVYSNVKGEKEIDLVKILNEFGEQAVIRGSITAFALLFPLLILSFVIIWLFAWYIGNKWALATYASVIVNVFIFIIGAGYQVSLEVYEKDSLKSIHDYLSEIQQSKRDSVVYEIQGLLAAACAVTCEEGEKCWYCNDDC